MGKLTFFEVVYTGATVISEARKSPIVSALVGQRALDNSWNQGLHVLECTSKPRSTRCAKALQGLCQSRAGQDDSSFEATLNAEHTRDDFTIINSRNDGGISQDALGDLDDFMFAGPPAELAFGDSLEWLEGAMT